MAGKIIMQVTYTSPGASAAYKTVAFTPTMTVEAARDLCALKGGIRDNKEDFGLAIKDTNTWLQPGDTLDKYNLQKAAGLEFKLTPQKTKVQYEEKEKSLDIDFALLASEVLALILEAFGEPKSNEFSLSVITEDQKAPSIDYTKPLIHQAKPGSKLIIKKKSKIGTIFRRTESMKTKRETLYQGATGPTRVFGVPLAQVAHPAKYGGLPAVVAKTIEYLEDCALQLEGIFRISGNQSEVLNLKKAFDEGVDVNIGDCSSPHVAAGLLKLYLRDLPEPLFSFKLYDLFIAVNNTVDNMESRILYYKVMIDTLPLPNRKMLNRILPFLADVVKYENVNKMAIHNVATVFGPNMLRSQDTSAMVMIQGTAAVNAITCDLIKNYDVIIEPCEYDFCAIGRTLYPYEGNSDSELTFKEGDVLFIIKEDDTGWWEGEVNGNYGFFPKNYVETILHIKREPATNIKSATTSEFKSANDESQPSQEPENEPEPEREPVEVEPEPEPEPEKEPEPEPVSAPVIQQPAVVVEKPVPAPKPKPRTSTTGGSKQKFLNDLEDLKRDFQLQSINNQQLESLIKSLSNELAQLKQRINDGDLPSSTPAVISVPDTNLSNEVENLKSNLSAARAEINLLNDENLNLREEVRELRSIVTNSQEEIEKLAESERTIKRDFKIMQFKLEKQSKAKQATEVRRPALSKPQTVAAELPPEATSPKETSSHDESAPETPSSPEIKSVTRRPPPVLNKSTGAGSGVIAGKPAFTKPRPPGPRTLI